MFEADDIQMPTVVPKGLSYVETTLGLAVCNVHYTADPNKRDPAWRKHYSKGWDSRDWAREFELDWSVADGEPVFKKWDKSRHLSQLPLQAIPGHPIYLGWDFGLNPAVLFIQVVNGQTRVFRCLTDNNETMTDFAPRVVQLMLDIHRAAGFRSWAATWADIERVAREARLASDTLDDKRPDIPAPLSYKAAVQSALNMDGEGCFEWVSYGDPYGSARNDNDGETTYKTCRRFGFRILPGKQAWQTRRNAVSERLTAPDIPEVGPAFIVSNDPSCDILVAGFDGGYKYGESVGSKEMPEKNKFSHPHDALQYPLTMLFPAQSESAVIKSVATDYRAVQAQDAAPAPSERTASRSSAFMRFDTRNVKAAKSAGWNPWVQSQLIEG